jgi:hypothetical protein
MMTLRTTQATDPYILKFLSLKEKVRIIFIDFFRKTPSFIHRRKPRKRERHAAHCLI